MLLNFARLNAILLGRALKLKKFFKKRRFFLREHKKIKLKA